MRTESFTIGVASSARDPETFVQTHLRDARHFRHSEFQQATTTVAAINLR